MRASQKPDTGSSTYPPSVYAVAEDRRAVPPAGVLWWLGSTVLLGVLVGIAWWLLAPTGRIFGDPLASEDWLLRDLTLVGLELLAGITVGTLVALRLRLAGVTERVLAAIGGSILGSLLALGVGQGLAHLLGPHGRDDLPGSDFLLASYGALAVWPTAATIIVFATALIGLARRRN